MANLQETSTLEQLLRCSTRSQRDTVAAILENRTLWAPQSEPQWLALLSEADELFYGGQAGGGKSDLILGLALIAHKRSVIVRREFSQLAGTSGLIERSRDILGDRGRYNGQEHVWRDIPGGRTLEFGGVQYEDDKRKYQGRPHDLIAFDEGTEFTESQFQFLTGWARSTDPDQRVRVVVTGNPPTHAAGRWVIQHWGPWLDDRHPNPANPGELRWFAVLDGQDKEVDGPGSFDHNGETVLPKSRTFIPAALSDNPFLRDSAYGAILQGLPEPLRSQLLYGDFSIGVSDDPWQVIPTEWVRAAFARYEAGVRPEVALSCVGADVARGGDDQTVICKRFGNWFPPVIKYAGKDTPDGPSAAHRIAEALEGSDALINVDVIGIGSSAYDSLAGMDGVNAWPVNFAERSSVTDKTGKLAMRNKRAEAYWTAREALDPTTGDNLAIAPDNELLADLTSPRYKVTASGILVESKEDIIARLHHSPDCGDAFVLSLLGGGWFIF